MIYCIPSNSSKDMVHIPETNYRVFAVLKKVVRKNIPQDGKTNFDYHGKQHYSAKSERPPPHREGTFTSNSSNLGVCERREYKHRGLERVPKCSFLEKI